MGQLTARKASSLRKKPGLHRIARGLYMRVRPNGAWWCFRYMVDGRAHELGLGNADLVTLAAATREAMQLRMAISDGQDPMVSRKAKRESETFREIAEALIASKSAGWTNLKHRAQWTSTLTAYAFPVLGKMDVAQIETEHVLAVLTPLWGAKHETATRVRQRVEAVLSAAAARGLRSKENPARWRGHLETLLPTLKKSQRVKHHPALPWGALPEFIGELHKQDGTGARALEFLILTACRAGEVAGAQISEIDLDAALWTVPTARMKAKREHRVPLSPRALEIVREAALGRISGPLFVGQRQDVAITTAALSRVLARMQRDTITVHGFRSTFRDWVGEATSHSGEVAEQALAHRIEDKTEAAYRRGDMLARRRAMMVDWMNFAAGQAAAVTPIRRTARR